MEQSMAAQQAGIEEPYHKIKPVSDPTGRFEDLIKKSLPFGLPSGKQLKGAYTAKPNGAAQFSHANYNVQSQSFLNT